MVHNDDIEPGLPATLRRVSSAPRSADPLRVALAVVPATVVEVQRTAEGYVRRVRIRDEQTGTILWWSRPPRSRFKSAPSFSSKARAGWMLDLGERTTPAT